jgi:hypothetical protein
MTHHLNKINKAAKGSLFWNFSPLVKDSSKNCSCRRKGKIPMMKAVLNTHLQQNISAKEGKVLASRETREI